jgi:dTDP-4-amino-4,6-dideoxygalactose transaminase
MAVCLSRTLPAVGHKIALRPLIEGMLSGETVQGGDLLKKTPGAIYTSSGTAALVVALEACKIGSSRRKVILPAYTCPSVLASVGQAGLQAVLCELAPGQLGIGERQLSALLDEDTLAVVYVHLFGLDHRAQRIAKLAGAAGAFLIEDAAQALGNYADGGAVGSDGDLVVYSFGRGKPLSVLHGGAVAANNPVLTPHIAAAFSALKAPLPKWFEIYYRLLISAYHLLFDPRWFGLPQALPWFRIGETVYIEHTPVYPMGMPARRVMRRLLPRLNDIQQTRRRVAMRYLEQLSDLADIFYYLPPREQIVTGPLRFPVVFHHPELKAECLARLSELRLGVSGSYPVPLNRQEGVPADIASQGPFPNAEKTSGGILTLPTHEYVTEEDIAAITNSISILASKYA